MCKGIRPETRWITLQRDEVSLEYLDTVGKGLDYSFASQPEKRTYRYFSELSILVEDHEVPCGLRVLVYEHSPASISRGRQGEVHRQATFSPFHGYLPSSKYRSATCRTRRGNQRNALHSSRSLLSQSRTSFYSLPILYGFHCSFFASMFSAIS